MIERDKEPTPRDETPRKPFIEPFNAFTGQISVLAIFENLQNGYDTFPEDAGRAIRVKKKPKALTK